LGDLGRGSHWGGAIADRLLVPYADAMLVVVPSGVDHIAIASVADNVPDAYRAVGPGLAAHAGESVLICGGWARSIGLYAILAAQALGAGEVVYADRDADRLAKAEGLGARVLEGYPRKAGSFAVTVDASGDPTGLGCAARSTAVGGLCTACAIYFDGAELPLLEMYTTGITFVTGRVNARATIPAVLDLVAARQLPISRVTTRVAGWEEAPEAFADLPVKLILAR
jgi:alcohol dehydrogenase